MWRNTYGWPGKDAYRARRNASLFFNLPEHKPNAFRPASAEQAEGPSPRFGNVGDGSFQGIVNAVDATREELCAMLRSARDWYKRGGTRKSGFAVLRRRVGSEKAQKGHVLKLLVLCTGEGGRRRC